MSPCLRTIWSRSAHFSLVDTHTPYLDVSQLWSGGYVRVADADNGTYPDVHAADYHNER